MNTLPYIKDNLEALAQAKNPAAFWLAHQHPDEQAVMDNIFMNRWQLLDYRLPEGQGMFEALPPDASYQGWLPDKRDAGGSLTVIVGCNLGYGLNHVLVNTPNTHKVLVVEPDPEMLLACLGQTDYSPFIRMGKLHFLPPDQDTVAKAFQQCDLHFLFGRIYLHADMPSRQRGPQYARWTRICQGLLENLSVELATLRQRQDLMVNNELRNYRQAMVHGSIAPLKGSANGLTGVILGAGPSLMDTAPVLAANPGHAVYATSLQSLSALRKVGLTPHFCAAIDFGKVLLNAYKELDHEWAARIPLLYSTKVDPEVVARYPGPTIPFWTLGGLGTYAMQAGGNLQDAGGNVSVTLYRLLHWCGVSRILLCGQDFAWKAEQSHAAGHYANLNFLKDNVSIQNLAGETLHTTLPFMAALRDMEKDIRTFGLPTYNFYGGLAVINGAVNVDAATLLDQGLHTSVPGSRERFLDALRRAATPRQLPPIEPRQPSWSPSLRHALKHLEKLFKKAHNRQQEIREALGAFQAFLRHDPLYMPYLYNEFMDIAGLLHGARTLTAKDHATFKNVVKRVQHKVQEMDSLIAEQPGREHHELQTQAA